MPRPAMRNRKRRRVQVKTPGGRNVTRYLRRKPGKAKCSLCKKELHGIPRSGRLTKSQKSVARPYGGNLCSRCMREKIKLEIKISS